MPAGPRLAVSSPAAGSGVSGSISSSTLGRKIRNVAPAPGSLVTRITPPLWRTMPYTVARPSPVPLAAALRGEERLEDVVPRGVVHADAGVAHPQHDVGPRHGRAGIVEDDVGVGGGDRELSASRHRVAGVHGEVDEDLLDLSPVRPDAAELRVERLDERHLFAEKPAEHPVHVGDDAVEVSHPWLQHLPARIRQQLPRQRRGPVGRPFDLLEVFPVRVRRVEFEQDQFAGAQDGGQHVVEVVGDAACQLPDRLHLLRLGELGLEALALREVGHDPDHPARAPLRVPLDDPAPVQHPGPAPVPGTESVLDFVDRLQPADVRLARTRDGALVVRMEPAFPLSEVVADFPRLEAEEERPARRERDLARTEVPVPGGAARRLQRQVEPLGALPRRPLARDSLRDIAVIEDERADGRMREPVDAIDFVIAPAVVLVADAMRHAHRLARRIKRLLEGGERRGKILGVNQREGADPDDVRRFVSGDPGRRRGLKDDRPVGAQEGDRVAAVLDQGAEPLLVRLALAPRRPLRRDVAGDDEHAVGSHRRERAVEPARLPVEIEVIVVRDGRAGGERFADEPNRQLGEVGWEELPYVPAEHLGRGADQELGMVGGDLEIPPVAIEHHDEIGQRCQQRPHLRLGAPERFLRPVPLGHVLHEPVHHLRAVEADAERDPHRRPVRPEHAHLEVANPPELADLGDHLLTVLGALVPLLDRRALHLFEGGVAEDVEGGRVRLDGAAPQVGAEDADMGVVQQAPQPALQLLRLTSLAGPVQGGPQGQAHPARVVGVPQQIVVGAGPHGLRNRLGVRPIGQDHDGCLRPTLTHRRQQVGPAALGELEGEQHPVEAVRRGEVHEGQGPGRGDHLEPSGLRQGGGEERSLVFVVVDDERTEGSGHSHPG